MIKQIIFDYYNTLFDPKSGSLFDGTETLLTTLLKRGSELNLITTESKNRLIEIKQIRIDKYFTKIIISKKKTKSIFANIIYDPSKTLIIGDRIEEEIKIGKSLKTKVLLVNPLNENPIDTINKLFN